MPLISVIRNDDDDDMQVSLLMPEKDSTGVYPKTSQTLLGVNSAHSYFDLAKLFEKSELDPHFFIDCFGKALNRRLESSAEESVSISNQGSDSETHTFYIGEFEFARVQTWLRPLLETETIHRIIQIIDSTIDPDLEAAELQDAILEAIDTNSSVPKKVSKKRI